MRDAMTDLVNMGEAICILSLVTFFEHLEDHFLKYRCPVTSERLCEVQQGKCFNRKEKDLLSSTYLDAPR